jgi:hypothetical protein
VEGGGTSTFVTHDVTKVEVRWAETHLKPKSHTSKERGRLTPRTSVGLSVAQGQRGSYRPRVGPGPSPTGPGQSLGLALLAQGRAMAVAVALALAMALVMAMAVAVLPNFFH